LYKELTANNWRKNLKLPKSYKIDGVLIYGTGNKKKEYKRLKQSLESLEYSYTIETLKDNFFETSRLINIGSKNIWFDIVYGGAYMSEALHIASKLGSKINIFLGSTGGLQTGATTGDIIVPSYSYGEESSTKIYNRTSIDNCHFPDKELSSEIYNKIDKQFNPKRGSIITCQAMLGETWTDIQRWSAEGYSGVEMETATFFAVSKHFKVPAAAILYIADNLIEKEDIFSEKYTTSKDKREQVREHIYQLALETLLKRA
jgi:purine-nucleoside phosphorylase